jgi:hypothetical protein
VIDPKFRATARMAAMRDCGWDEATDFVEHTFEGQMLLLNEQAREVARVFAREYPRLTKMISYHPVIRMVRWIWRQF